MGHTHLSTVIAMLGALGPADQATLLARARTLQRNADAARVQPLLRGKNFGLLCPDASAARAAVRAGRQRAWRACRPHRHELGERSSAHEVAHTARMLGRLYDAVECHGLPAALVRRMADESGIAVYDAYGANDPLLSGLALQLGSPSELSRNRRFALQALLLYALE